MKTLILLSLSLVATSAMAGANHDMPHFDLEMTSQEYRKLVKPHQPSFFNEKPNYVNKAIQAGEKLFVWLEKINAERPDDQKIRLTSKSTRKGIPISSPKKYGPVTIEKDYKELSADIPTEMGEVIFKQAPTSADPLVEDKVFIEFGRKVDRLYQTAARWRMLSPYKGVLEQRRVKDVRGLYHLQTNGWDKDKLKADFADLDQTNKDFVVEALAGICMNNSRPYTTCLSEASNLETGSQAADFYQRYINRSQKTWDAFYEISGNRRDIKWNTTTPNIARIPFKNPQDAAILSFVKDNVEDEFQWEDWGLKLDVVPSGRVPYIRFVAGATPNVNGLGGNRITMDANKSIDEYEVQWVIRHEFGHVLGLPDCYHEFYDRENNVFINYQLDTSDLMCSRAGNMNERIYLQMKDAYQQ